jgi:hypothetical protein
MAAPPHILLVKEKGVAPTRSSTTVYQVFVFNSKVEVFNNFFRHNMMNRFQVPTKMGETPYVGLCNLLDTWSKSKYPDDTLCDSTLPMPNTKDFVWKDSKVNKTIHDERWKLTNDRSRSRKRIDLHELGLKEKMFHDLVTSPCFVIEMREDTLNNALKNGAINLTHQFFLPQKVNQSTIDKTDLSTQRTELNFIGALEVSSYVRASIIHSYVKKKSRGESLRSLYDDVDYDDHDDNDDGDGDSDSDDDDDDEDDDYCVPRISSTVPGPSVNLSMSSPYRRANPKRQATEQQGPFLSF